MADLLGPASAPNSVTARPADARVFGNDDTWMQGCTAPDIDDGTEIQADFLNGLIAQMRNAIRGMGVAANNADDDMLLKAIRSSGLRFVSDTGSGNAMVVTNSPALSAYGDGLAILVKSGQEVSGPLTINCDGLGAKAAVHPDGRPLADGDWPKNAVRLIVYSGGRFQVLGIASRTKMFPDVDGAGTFTVSQGSGAVVVGSGQSWTWRGGLAFSTSAFSGGDLTLATAANKTYHLRWNAPGTGAATPRATYQSGRFVLKDLADGAYNPSSLAETDALFDSNYDDMLVARIVTNSSNVATITSLTNKHSFSNVVGRSTINSIGSGGGNYRTDNYTFNLARTPRVALTGFWGDVTGGQDSELGVDPTSITRYGMSVTNYVYSVTNNATYTPKYSFTVSI